MVGLTHRTGGVIRHIGATMHHPVGMNRDLVDMNVCPDEVTSHLVETMRLSDHVTRCPGCMMRDGMVTKRQYEDMTRQNADMTRHIGDLNTSPSIVKL